MDRKVVIHTDVLSPFGWAARLAAAEKGLDVEVRPVDLTSPAHRRLHPFGKMPVLQHGDIVVYETLAIAHYIDRAFAGPALQPLEPLAQSEMLRWISIVCAYVQPVMNGIVKERSSGSWRADPPPDEAVIAALVEPLRMQVALIEQALGAHAFLVGDHYTLADAFLTPQVQFVGFTPEGAAALGAAPATRAWLERMRQRPSFAATNPFAMA
jgi:glutathione S-transferase